MYRKRYCATPGVGDCVSIGVEMEVFVISKALSGEPSCTRTGHVFLKAKHPPLADIALPSWDLLLKERICSKRSKFCSLRVKILIRREANV